MICRIRIMRKKTNENKKGTNLFLLSCCVCAIIAQKSTILATSTSSLRLRDEKRILDTSLVCLVMLIRKYPVCYSKLNA
jgi:hypothetical protein